MSSLMRQGSLNFTPDLGATVNGMIASHGRDAASQAREMSFRLAARKDPCGWEFWHSVYLILIDIEQPDTVIDVKRHNQIGAQPSP